VRLSISIVVLFFAGPVSADFFDSTICYGPQPSLQNQFTAADAQKYVSAAASQAELGKFQIYVRSRYCDQSANCGP